MSNNNIYPFKTPADRGKAVIAFRCLLQDIGDLKLVCGDNLTKALEEQIYMLAINLNINSKVPY